MSVLVSDTCDRPIVYRINAPSSRILALFFAGRPNGRACTDFGVYIFGARRVACPAMPKITVFKTRSRIRNSWMGRRTRFLLRRTEKITKKKEENKITDRSQESPTITRSRMCHRIGKIG